MTEENCVIDGDMHGNFVIGKNNTNGEGAPLVTDVDFTVESVDKKKSGRDPKTTKTPKPSSQVRSSSNNSNSITIGGKDLGGNTILIANHTSLEGRGKLVHAQLDSVTFNPEDEAKRLQKTRKNYSRLHKDIKYVEDADGLRDFLGDMAQDDHFATSEFLLEEYAIANNLKPDSAELQRFANLLIGSRNVNVDALKAKLDQRNTLNLFQKLLKETISNLAK